MKGKARSVFSGSKIEEFDVEILGVLHNWRPRGDLILAKASGPQVDYAGISAGMSGTPVYIEGKLIGAMAYTWPFSKDAIAGITPIGEMLEIRTPAIGTGPSRSAPEPRERGEAELSELGISPGGIKAIETPLLISGFHPAVLRIIEKETSGLNVIVAQTGGAGDAVVPDTLVPGAALAAQFVTGDGLVAAIGTVTYTEGDWVLGFGHGLSLGGLVSIPMSTAFVHAVLPSIAGSLKIASPSRMVGTITNENLSGIFGRLGNVPKLIPVDISVKTDRDEQRDFHFNVMTNDLLTGTLAGWGAANALVTVAGSVGDMTIDAKSKTTLFDERGRAQVFEYADVFFTNDAASDIAKMVSVPVELLLRNEFEKARIQSVQCTFLVKRDHRVASIEEIYVSPQVAVPGDSIEVMVRLKPYRGESFFERLSVAVPPACEGGSLKVLASSAPDMRVWEAQSTNRRLPATNLQQLISQITSAGNGNRLECVIYSQKEEAGIGGKAFPSPPSSFSNVLRSTTRSGAVVEKPAAVLAGSSLKTDYVIEGSRSVSVKLKRQKAGR